MIHHLLMKVEVRTGCYLPLITGTVSVQISNLLWEWNMNTLKQRVPTVHFLKVMDIHQPKVDLLRLQDGKAMALMLDLPLNYRDKNSYV